MCRCYASFNGLIFDFFRFRLAGFHFSAPRTCDCALDIRVSPLLWRGRGSLRKEYALNSGLGFIVICPDIYI